MGTPVVLDGSRFAAASSATQRRGEAEISPHEVEIGRCLEDQAVAASGTDPEERAAEKQRIRATVDELTGEVERRRSGPKRWCWPRHR